MASHVVILTGTIASGKSTAARVFVSRGAELIDLDEITHELLSDDRDVIAYIAEEFPTSVQEGSVDRMRLAELVFNDERARLKLEAILHPNIIARACHLIDTSGNERVVVEIPLLDRCGELLDRADEIILIHASEDSARSRALKRGMTESEYEKRKHVQPSDSWLRDKATTVIENNGSKKELVSSVHAVIDTLKAE